MESFVRTQTSFHGSHALQNHPLCAKDCGHTWTVEVLVAGEESAERYSMPLDELKLYRELVSISEELDGKDIGKMVKPSYSSQNGIAHWFYERLASRYDVREVVVWQDGGWIKAVLRAP